MRILVCVKQVPATSNVEVDEVTGVLKREGAAAKLNPYDLYALELGFTLREKHGGSVDVLTMGPPAAKSALYEALCMGADSAYLLSDARFAGSDVLATSRALAGAIRLMELMGEYDLIVCGKQTTDGDTAQVGPALAEILGMQHASYVQRLSIEEGMAHTTISFGDGELKQLLPLPCLITVEKDVNTPRLPGYRRSKEVSIEDIKVLTLDDFKNLDKNAAGNADESLYGLSGSPTQVERIFPPESGADREIIHGDADYLAQRAVEILRDGKFLKEVPQ